MRAKLTEHQLENLNQDLLVAIEDMDLDSVRDIIDNEGADVTFNNHEPVRVSAMLGSDNNPISLEIFKFLVSRRGNCEALKGTPLRLAIQSNWTALVRYLLLEKRVNPDLTSEYSPLTIAVRENNLELAKLLLEARADVFAINHQAIRFVKSEEMFLLIGAKYQNFELLKEKVTWSYTYLEQDKDRIEQPRAQLLLKKLILKKSFLEIT